MRNVGKNGNQNGKELFISNYPIIDEIVNIQGTLFDGYDKIEYTTEKNNNKAIVGKVLN